MKVPMSRRWQGLIAAFIASLAYVLLDMRVGKMNMLPEIYGSLINILLILIASSVGYFGGGIIEDAEKSRDKEKGLSEKLETLHATNIKITSSQNQDEIFRCALEALRKILGFTTAGIFSIEDNKLHFKKGIGEDTEPSAFPLSLDSEMGITVLAAREGKTIYVADVSREPRYIRGNTSTKSEAAVPIMCHDTVVGVLDVESSLAISGQDIKMVEILASFMGCALEDIALLNNISQAKDRLEFLTDIMSHDMSNINTVTMGYLSLLSDTSLSENQRQFLEKALISIRRNSRLLEQVRKIERMESRGVEIEKISLRPLILEGIENAASFTTKEVDIQCFSEDVSVWGGELLSDVFLNLLDNAIRYSPSKARIEISLHHEDEHVIVAIRDWGMGIPFEGKDEIFKRFERQQKDKNGTGLGLYLVRRIVEKYRGEIWVEKNPEGGSIFFVRLTSA